MKKLFSIIGSALLTAGIFVSCDSVSEPDRFIPVEVIKPKRAVLIEEFTGQRCTNCPDGHEAIHNLLEIYPESVIPVSIQASNLAIPAAQGGLKTEVGEEYYKAYGSPALPTAVINKNTAPLMIEKWASSVVSILEKETPLQINLSAILDNENNTVNIDVDLESIEDLNGTLQVWVVENDIVGYQLDHGANVFNYVHNHVFRCAVNGTWGQTVNLQAYSPETQGFSQAVASDWNPANLAIVAFVYNDAEGVVQAAQCKVELQF